LLQIKKIKNINQKGLDPLAETSDEGTSYVSPPSPNSVHKTYNKKPDLGFDSKIAVRKLSIIPEHNEQEDENTPKKPTPKTSGLKPKGQKSSEKPDIRCEAVFKKLEQQG